MLSLFQMLAILLTATAIFAWLNHRLVRLPESIGVLVLGLATSLALVVLRNLFPVAGFDTLLTRSLRQIDFYDTVMHGLLGFLLFASAINVDLRRLRGRLPVVGGLATFGTAISTVVIAVALWWGTDLIGMPIGLAWAFVFGALIAPTDPVAVLAALRTVDVPENLETDLTGETLFNDGIAVVLFAVTVQFAGSGSDPGPDAIVGMLLLEAVGGALLGLATGYLAYRALHAIDDYATEVLISIALVSATYVTADALHMSGPISVVIAGVLIGNRGKDRAMSEVTRRYVFGFWRLVDEILNSVLFMLVGLELAVLPWDTGLALIGLIAVPAVLVGRFLSVSASVLVLSRWKPFAPGPIPVMTWGGVRGGVSVALVLSLGDQAQHGPLLAATYVVVLFSILVQGLTLGQVIRWALPSQDDRAGQRGA
ncbi:cation:proton antiporter [Methyloraptor flagellatus]|uniref:Sodium:proton antiporter n=1 Tax=Methyloraptor flagellatus TaxID=3162530 RepID=A0AAU7XGH3_9HYPH